MNPQFFIVIGLTLAAGIFFVWGTSITSVKHVGIGGIFLSIAVICLLLFSNIFV